VLAALAFLAFWFVALRPQALGGPAGYVLVSGHSMLPTLHDGDLVVVRHERSYRTGEIVAYRVPKGNVGAGDQVIHRIVGGSALSGYVVKGDNRSAPDVWRPRLHDVVGRVWLRIPRAEGVLRVLRSPLLLACLAGALVFVFVFTSGRRVPD
jgi:signal peptidase